MVKGLVNSTSPFIFDFAIRGHYRQYYEEVIDMVTKNVTKRAAKAMYLLSKANEDLTPLMHILNGEENLKQLFYSLKLIDEAQQELVKILAQDNKLEIEG